MTEPVDSTPRATEPELRGLDAIAADLAAVEEALQRIENGDFSPVVDPSAEADPNAESATADAADAPMADGDLSSVVDPSAEADPRAEGTAVGNAHTPTSTDHLPFEAGSSEMGGTSGGGADRAP